MIWVILRDHKVLQYNTANNLDVVNGVLELVRKDGKGRKFWVACLPLEVVERVEWVKPCHTLRDASTRKKAIYQP